MLNSKRGLQHDYALFLLVASLLLSLLAFRDPILISDGDSYVSHAELSVDFSDPIYYLYPLYWAAVAFFGPIFGKNFPSLLSIVVSVCLVISSKRLSCPNRYVFIGLVVLNSISFVVLQVALKNGLALGVLFLGISTGYSFLYLAALLIHPGVFPVAMLVFFLKKFDLTFRSFFVFLVLALFLHYAGQSLFTEIVDVRGYADEGQVEGEIFSTYLFYSFLASLYFFALKNNRLKWFLPLMVVFWIALGGAYSFSWRMFAQAIPVAVFLLLLYSKGAGLYKYSFLGVFFASSVYWAFKWHPLVDYSDGWFGYWLSFV